MDLVHDHIQVGSRPVKGAAKIYLMMNKPRGLVTTASDEKGRATVYSILEQSRKPLPWVAPVGRLDKASEGLLLLTNDSEWGARLADPGTHLEKTYHVQIGALVDEGLLNSLTAGIAVRTGEVLRSRKARLLRSGVKNCWIEIVLDEGKNRQIRRMLEALGIEVLRLVRVAIGPLQLGVLPKATIRELSKDEKLSLDRAMRS